MKCDEKIVELIFEAVNIMLPILTGYLILFAGALAKVLELKRGLKPVDYRFAFIVFAIGIISMGFWAGALAMGILFFAGEGASLLFIPVPHESKILIARKFVACGYTGFIATLIVSIVYFFKVAIKLSTLKEKV